MLVKYEAIDLLEKAGAYTSGINNLSGGLWREVLDKVEEAIRDNAIPVYTIVLTSTLSRLKSIPLNEQPNPLAPRYEKTLESIGIKVDDSDAWKKELEKYYGEDRSDWKPFCWN